MGEFTVAKLKEIGTTKESIEIFKNYKKKKNKPVVKKKKSKKVKKVYKNQLPKKTQSSNQVSFKEEKRLLQLGRKFSKELKEKATRWELIVKQFLEELGYDFTFQYYTVAVDKLFILDFYFPEYKLGLEIDGKSTHGSKEQIKADNERTKKLKKLGISIIRLWNSQVDRFTKDQINDIIQTKLKMLKKCKLIW